MKGSLSWFTAAAAVKLYNDRAFLVMYDGFDNVGNSMIMEPMFENDPTVQKCYVDPNATKFTLTLSCGKDQDLFVDGSKTDNGSDVAIKRSREVHTQVVDVECAAKRLPEDPLVVSRQQYAFLVNADWDEIDIPVPTLFSDGVQCEIKGGKFECPKSEGATVSMTSVAEPSVKYILHDYYRSVEMRLLTGKTVVPFEPSSTMYVTATAGRHSNTWPVSFGGSIIHSLLNAVGVGLAGVLCTLCASLLLVVGFAGACGQGIPIGATEIACALTFVIQFLSFANIMRGSAYMESLVTPMKWLSFFWPPPNGSTPSPGASNSEFSRGYGLSLWGDGVIGDVTDVNNAWGCVLWLVCSLGVLVIFHAVARMVSSSARYTRPHRLDFGNWEARYFDWIVFPLSVATVVLTIHPDSTPKWIGIAWLTLAGIIIYLCVSLIAVNSSIGQGDVCWVWNSSVREAGPNRVQEMSGYWADVVNDQLKTQPVDRAILGGVFPYTWTSTVGDIQPVSLNSASIDQAEIHPTQKLKKSHKGASYLLAKNPQIASVYKARQPSTLYRGHRLVVGLLRTKWLDLLYTYEGVTNFHMTETSECDMPLVVKTNQLSGPITDGYGAYFFDGARVPFIRFAQMFYKIVIGLATGVVIASQDDAMVLSAYTTMAILSVLTSIYIIIIRPYNRCIENYLLTAVNVIVGGAAAAMAFSGQQNGRSSSMSDLLLALLAGVSVILGLYAIIIIASLYGAVCCPPLHETRFLEKLANCTVVVSDPVSGHEYELCAYCKYASKDLLARSTSGRVTLQKFGTHEDLEIILDHEDVQKVCTTGVLSTP